MEILFESENRRITINNYELLVQVIRELDEEYMTSEMISELASHPSKKVRDAISDYKKLPYSIIQQLLRDKSPDVVQNVINNHTKMFKKEDLDYIIETENPDLLLHLAKNLYDINEEYIEHYTAILCKASEPEVREFTARYTDLIQYLEILAGDEENGIAKYAKEQLKRRVERL